MNELPTGAEPLVLADGTKIDPINGGVIKDEEVLVRVPNNAEIKREITASRMRLADLPVPPAQMNTLSVILSYSLQGISDNDISNVLAIDTQTLVSIKSTDAYKSLQDTIVRKIIESDVSNVRNMFVEHSQAAANVVLGVMADDENGPVTRMTAANSILDRGGHRPVDIVEHRHKMEGGLTIEYIEKKDDIPTIDITPKEF
jgi:hypothetical protein